MADNIKELEEQISKKIEALIFDTHREIILNTPVDTGRLRGSIVVEKTDDGWVIGTNVEYAEMVELGTKAHVITPVNKSSLKFSIGGQDVFAKRVHHPGTEGSHMFLKGVNYFERNIKNIVN